MFRWLTPMLEGENALDGVLVSDVGKRIEVQSSQRGGLIRAAMRSSDILMDRVWQLESENFQDTFGFVFARITDVVGASEDSTALHPEIQRQTANIRTDLDEFSPLETSCLIRHGYCIARKACRSRADLFGTNLPSDPPWDPVPEVTPPPNAPPPNAAHDPQPAEANLETSPTTVQARQLQVSASRRIWSRLLNLRDWPSYVYMPLIALVLLAPYFVYDSYQHSRRVARLIEYTSDSGPDIEVMSRLIRRPMKPFDGVTAEDVGQLDPPDYKGFSVLQDAHIIDFRSWKPIGDGNNDSTMLVYGYRRLKVQKASKDGNDVFRVISAPSSPDSQFRFPPQQFPPKLRRMVVENPKSSEKTAQFEVSIDMSKAPMGQVVDIVYEHYSRGPFLHGNELSTTCSFRSDFDAAEVTRWFLMPRGREFRNFQILRYETGKPQATEVVKALTEFVADDSSIFAYKMVSLKAGYTFDVTWFNK
jgi:hypothetical protein